MRAMPSKQAYQWRYFETMANNVFDLHNDAKNVNLNSTTSGGGAGGGTRESVLPYMGFTGMGSPKGMVFSRFGQCIDFN